MKNSILAISILFFSNAVVSQPKVSIVPKPANILIELGENNQYINFDFLITNHTNDTLTINKLMVSVFDNTNKLIHSRFLDNNGTAPSINLIPNRKFNRPSSHLIFNPFADFSLTMPLSKLIYEWTFSDNSENEIKINSVITPQK